MKLPYLVTKRKGARDILDSADCINIFYKKNKGESIFSKYRSRRYFTPLVKRMNIELVKFILIHKRPCRLPYNVGILTYIVDTVGDSVDRQDKPSYRLNIGSSIKNNKPVIALSWKTKNQEHRIRIRKKRRNNDMYYFNKMSKAVKTLVYIFATQGIEALKNYDGFRKSNLKK